MLANDSDKAVARGRGANALVAFPGTASFNSCPCTDLVNAEGERASLYSRRPRSRGSRLSLAPPRQSNGFERRPPAHPAKDAFRERYCWWRPQTLRFRSPVQWNYSNEPRNRLWSTGPVLGIACWQLKAYYSVSKCLMEWARNSFLRCPQKSQASIHSSFIQPMTGQCSQAVSLKKTQNNILLAGIVYVLWEIETLPTHR